MNKQYVKVKNTDYTDLSYKMKHIKLIETILYVNDQQASTDFYKKLFRQNPNLNVSIMTEFKLAENYK